MRPISIGAQGFADIREQGAFYIDKTSFIRSWWESLDPVTLITRPRRFGKTLNMSMLECFFSNQYAGRADLFEGLEIWKDERYRQMQGTYPVIFLSFADVKESTYEEARISVIGVIANLFQKYMDLWQQDSPEEKERYAFMHIGPDMPDAEIARTLQRLSAYLQYRYGKKVLILLDEYDTPLQEAFVNGYWDSMAAFIRGLFNATFKSNPSLERAILTGITRVSKESIFSDLNNLAVITTTSTQYADAFGFTEDEVFRALDEYGYSGDKTAVKRWYDGFTFGQVRDIYNPWSIINYLKRHELHPYWANTSSNGLISYELRYSDNEIKQEMETLLAGGCISSRVDEEIIYSQLEENPEAIWSLFLAAGYLKVNSREFDGRRYQYQLSLTNLEVEIMFEDMISGWFAMAGGSNDEFVRAMVRGDAEGMTRCMNKITEITFSSFDGGRKPSSSTPPEKFYHGFVLGLLVRENERYRIRSNRESGDGRYDICMFPKQQTLPGIIIEFKVQNAAAGEQKLEDTAETALRQIRDKDYAADLREEGATPVYEYGFAFAGKRVLVRRG